MLVHSANDIMPDNEQHQDNVWHHIVHETIYIEMCHAYTNDSNKIAKLYLEINEKIMQIQNNSTRKKKNTK